MLRQKIVGNFFAAPPPPSSTPTNRNRHPLIFLLISLFLISIAMLHLDTANSNTDKKVIRFLDGFDERTGRWFRELAQKCPKNQSRGDLHRCSGWEYLSTEEYDEMMMQGVFLMDPPVRDGNSIADVGMGTGGPFASLLQKFPNMHLHGVDLSPDAIATAKTAFPEHAANFHVGNMTIRNETALPSDSFDHVVSFGALAMYLSVEHMVIAMKEAVRATKPGGSLLFTHFWPHGSEYRGSIHSAVDATFWLEKADELGVTNVRGHCMTHQGDRYMVTMRKKHHAGEAAVNQPLCWPTGTTPPVMFLNGHPITPRLACGVNNCMCAHQKNTTHAPG